MTDRFFLNVVEGDDDTVDSRYVFNRSEYMKNLCKEDVKCVVLSTFGFDVESSRQEISCLLGPDSTIPTLIVHGDRRRAVHEASLFRKANSVKASARESQGMDAQNTSGKNHFQNANSVSSEQEEDIPPMKCSLNHSQITLPESVRIERILPQWHPVDHASSLDSSSKPGCSNRTTSSLCVATAHMNSTCSSSSSSSSSNNSKSDNNYKNNNSSSNSSRSNTNDSSNISNNANSGNNNDKNSSNSIPIVPQCVRNADHSDRVGGCVMGVHHSKYILTFTSLGIHVLIR
jgi:hypothetical protein